MAETYVVIDGITASCTVAGDIKLIIHPEDLAKSLSLLTARENNTFIAVAGKRDIISRLGHTHHKPRVLQLTCQKAEIS